VSEIAAPVFHLGQSGAIVGDATACGTTLWFRLEVGKLQGDGFKKLRFAVSFFRQQDHLGDAFAFRFAGYANDNEIEL
jgi:hypothetical protein